MFICCTAITICTKATSAVDPRLNRVLPNGTVVPKDNMFTQAAAEKGTQNFWFCKMLNSEWFSDSRFDIDCAIIEENEKAGNFLTKPKPFGERYCIFPYFLNGSQTDYEKRRQVTSRPSSDCFFYKMTSS